MALLVKFLSKLKHFFWIRWYCGALYRGTLARFLIEFLWNFSTNLFKEVWLFSWVFFLPEWKRYLWEIRRYLEEIAEEMCDGIQVDYRGISRISRIKNLLWKLAMISYRISSVISPELYQWLLPKVYQGLLPKLCLRIASESGPSEIPPVRIPQVILSGLLYRIFQRFLQEFFLGLHQEFFKQFFS